MPRTLGLSHLYRTSRASWWKRKPRPSTISLIMAFSTSSFWMPKPHCWKTWWPLPCCGNMAGKTRCFSTTRTWKWTSIYLTRRRPSKYAILFQTQQPLNGRPRLLSIYARSYPARIYSLSPGMRKGQWSWEAEK